MNTFVPLRLLSPSNALIKLSDLDYCDMQKYASFFLYLKPKIWAKF